MKRSLVIATITGLIAMTVVALGGGTVITGPVAVPNNSITDVKLRDSAALSVIGRASNSSGDPADIAASSDDYVLRRSGTSIGFGTVATGGIADGAITDGKLRDGSALSVIGRSSNSTGDPGDISAGADDYVLRRSGTTLGFGTVATAGIADDAITDAKLRNTSALSVIGRSANSSGDPGDIATSSDGDVLRRSGTSLGFGQVATAGITDGAVTLAKMADLAASRFIGRTSGTGAPEAMTGTQATALLDSVTTSVKGLVPTAPNDTTKFLRGDATWDSAFPTGSLSASNASWSGTIAASTDGTIDWFCGGLDTGNAMRLVGDANLHAKALGDGEIHQSFDWVFDTGGTLFSQNFTDGATTTAADDIAQTALTANVTGRGINSATGGVTDFGFRFRAPATRTSRTMKIYTSHFSAILTLTARLSDGSAADATSTDDSGAATAHARVWTVTYKSSAAGYVLITVLVTTNRGSTPNVKFSCVTVAPT